MKELSIIIVNYNSFHYLRNCIISIESNTVGVDYEIIVIDNCSQEEELQEFIKKYPRVRLITSKENLGFSKANNIGFKASLGRNILFLNPDCVILNNSFVKMLDYINTNKHIGILGPKLYRDKNKNYHPLIVKYVSPLYMIVMNMPLHYLLSKFYIKYIYNDNIIHYVDWVSGAALMIKREVLDMIGLFDEHIFMYAEDEDLCFRAKKAGFDICYYPKAEIVHFGGKSSSTLSSVICTHYWKSHFYYFFKYYSKNTVKLFYVVFIRLIRIKLFFRIILPLADGQCILKIIKSQYENFNY